MRSTPVRPLLALLCVLTASGCGGHDRLSGDQEGYSYTSEEVPHPGIAEGRPVIRVPMRGTHYACPPLVRSELVPMLTDACLAPGDLGTSRLEEYSVLEPSVRCADGRFVTDAGTFGLGFVGEAWPPGDGPSPDTGAALDCLRAASSG